jgi:outer membrane protein assembly factor BamB
MDFDRLRRRRPWRKVGGLGIVVTIVTAALAVWAATPTRAVTTASQDWPMFLHDWSRTNATTDATLSTANAPSLAIKWKFKTGGPIATSVSIVGTRAYVGSWDGYEYAIDTTTGALVWKTNLGLTNDPGCNPAILGITSAAAVVNGVLYVGGGDANWYALDPATGAVLWSVFTGDNSQTGAHYNWSSPLIYNGAAYIGVASNCDNPLVQGHLMKVDLASHQVVADYNFVPNGQVGGGIWTSPAVDASTNTIFVSTGTLNDYTQQQSQAIVALDATTLQYKSSWALPFEAAVSDSDWGTTPTLVTDANGDQLLSVANKNGTLYTFDRNNLAAGPTWQRQVAIGGACPTCGDGSLASGIAANGMLYFAGGRNVQNGRGAGGSVSAFDPATGSVAWVHQTEQPIIGSPAYVNGMIAAVAGNTFQVLDASTGNLLYSYILGATGYGAVSVAYGMFYLGALDGNVYTFAPKAPTAPKADPNCPAGFVCQDIHNPSTKGSESTSSGILTVNGSGTGIKGTGDQFRLVSKNVSGDSQVSAQLVSQVANAGQMQQAGLIIRQSTDPASPLYAVLAYPNDSPPSLHVISRPTWGKNAVDKKLVVPFTTPAWLMIQRVGNLFTAGVSSDGVQFQRIPGSTVDMELPNVTLQGLAVSAGSSTNTGAASFANVAAGGAATTALSPPPPADACPAPWTCADLGNPAPIGDTTASGSMLNVAGAGGGFGGSTDALHYTYQSETADTTISAQVVTTAGANGATQDGLIMRASTLPTAPMYSVSLNPGGSATVRWRVYDGIKNSDTIPLASSTSPAYLEIARYSDTRFSPPVTFFSTMTSTDGVSWSPVLGSTVAIDMGPNGYLAGVAATSGANGATTAATFNNVQITATSPPPPGICPAGFTCSDIGTGIPAGNQIFLNGTWTMLASGYIQSVYDTFRFAYQNFPNDPANSQNGDGTISARVMSQTGGAPATQSGVMIRAGVDPQAPYYGVFVTPQQNVVVKWRSTKKGATTSVTQVGATTPLWVLASRYTHPTTGVTYYSAYTSTDGSNFTYVPGSQVSLTLPQPLVAGIASDANSTNVQSTSVFTGVAQLAGSQPPPVMCPSQWSCTDVGGALPAGQDQFTASTGTWNEFAGGGDIWGTADSFHFVSQSVIADGTAVAHITAQQPTSPWAKAGPMIRTSTDPGSPYYGAFVTPGNGIAVQWRSVQGGSSSQILAAGTVPTYLMVARYTTTGTPGQTLYTSYLSSDGSTWSAVPGSTVALTGIGSLAGFGITSHLQGTGESVALDRVAVTATEFPPPGLACPGGWSCADIASTPLGGQTLSGSSWSIQGGGSDIYGTADQFHFVWNTLSADGSISTRAASQTATSVWAKAGPMLRLTTDPGSPYYAILVTPANGVVVQWRKTAGAGTSQVQLTGTTTPVYLRVLRTGTTFTAATSPDGVAWTPITGSTVSVPALAGAVLRGFAVTSHNNTKISTVVFDNVVTAG